MKKFNNHDINLIDSAQSGNKDAFENLVTKYQDRIYNVLFRLTGNHEAALDITQDTFIKAYKNINYFKKKSAFFTWIFRIAVNIWISNKRREKKNIYSLSSNEETENIINLADNKIDEPSIIMVKKEKEKFIQNSILELPEHFRSILVLRDIEGLSYEEIQEILKVPLGTVRSRLHRAREMLKEKLIPFLNNEE